MARTLLHLADGLDLHRWITHGVPRPDIATATRSTAGTRGWALSRCRAHDVRPPMQIGPDGAGDGLAEWRTVGAESSWRDEVGFCPSHTATVTSEDVAQTLVMRVLFPGWGGSESPAMASDPVEDGREVVWPVVHGGDTGSGGGLRCGVGGGVWTSWPIRLAAASAENPAAIHCAASITGCCPVLVASSATRWASAIRSALLDA
jgi:hypothetical protein